MAIPTSELQSINPSAVIELFELQLIASIHGSSTLYRYHSGSNQNGNGEIVWQGNTYARFPIEAEGFEFTGRGQIPRPTLTVSNILSTLTTVIATVNAFTPANDLNGSKLTRIRTLASNLDAANFSPGSTSTLLVLLVLINFQMKYIIFLIDRNQNFRESDSSGSYS